MITRLRTWRECAYYRRCDYFSRHGYYDYEVFEQAVFEGILCFAGLLLLGWSQLEGRVLLSWGILAITVLLGFYTYMDVRAYEERMERRTRRH